MSVIGLQDHLIYIKWILSAIDRTLLYKILLFKRRDNFFRYYSYFNYLVSI